MQNLMSKYAKDYKIIGYFLTFSGPILFIIFALFFAASSYAEGSDTAINTLSSLIAILAFVLTVLSPFGIVFLVRRNLRAMSEVLESSRSKTEFSGLTDEQVVYIHEWSWGAFFGNFIWPAGEKLYGWMMGMFVGLLFPIVPLVLAYVLGKNGRSLAWKKGWSNFDEFKRRQKIMAWLSGLSFAALIVFSLFVGSFISATISENDEFGIQRAYENIMGENDKYTFSYYQSYQDRNDQIHADKTAEWEPVTVTLKNAKVVLINNAENKPVCLTVLTGEYSVLGAYYDYEQLFLSDDGEKSADDCLGLESFYKPMIGNAKSQYYFNKNYPSVISEYIPFTVN